MTISCLLYTSKLINNNARIVKADKGNTLVIVDTVSYNVKVHDFISNKLLKSDPTEIYVKELNNCINKRINLFKENTRRYLKPVSYTHLLY